MSQSAQVENLYMFHVEVEWVWSGRILGEQGQMLQTPPQMKNPGDFGQIVKVSNNSYVYL